MSDRKLELERKKQKLELMRKERQEKLKRQKESEEGTTVKPKSQDLRAETDELLRDLGIPPAADKETEKKVIVEQKSDSQTDSSQSTPTRFVKPKNVKLSLVKVAETNIPPRENVTYSKETQTLEPEPTERDDDETEADIDSIVLQSPSAIGTHKMPHVEMVAPMQTDEEKAHKEDKPVRELSEEERQSIMISEDFREFVSHSSRIIERALGDVDIYTDYSRSGEGEGKDDDLAGERLKLNRCFFDERWSKHRINTSLDWSTQHPELLLASYSGNEDAPHDPDGIALVWNAKYKKTTPEYVFHCQSAVMSSCFAKFHPNLVVGGTYSGQIVLWDNRVLKKTPIQRTPLSAAAHTHPVYCVNVVGTQNAHNLISVSTDGKMCSWNLDMLSQPQDSMELQHKQTKSVAVTSFSFLSGDVNNFVVGSEDCSVYTACRHGSKAGIIDMFEGHQGPVTGIDCHRVPGEIDFSPYFLTSSFDWSIKLWSQKEQKFLHSFEDNSDYVYDVQWSPIHPALFASVDGMGRLDLWNLNQELEVPSASVSVDTGLALNKCRWHQSGHVIAAGDDMGKIHLYDVAEHLANPKSDEWSRFVRTLQDIRQHAAEREEDTTLAGLGSPIR